MITKQQRVFVVEGRGNDVDRMRCISCVSNRHRSNFSTLISILMFCFFLLDHQLDIFVDTFETQQVVYFLRRFEARQQILFAPLFAAKGFGGSGKGTTSKKKSGKTKDNVSNTKKVLLKQVEQKYGGTTPQDIARGTQTMIDQSIQQLPQHIQFAIQLYRQQLDWNRRISGMDLLTQSQLPSQAVSQAQRIQDTLQSVLAEHCITIQDLQVIMQQITWNASADAKAAKSLTGNMPKDIENRVQRACDYAAEAVKMEDKDDGALGVLDVGCGYGVLVPYLQNAGLLSSQIHGMDLSSDMIRNAHLLYPQINFEIANFLKLDDGQQNNKYNAVIFCASLHDLPDMKQALEIARNMLVDKGGRIIIVHPQGASHVINQQKSNPVLVPRGLPNTEELTEWLCSDVNQSMQLIVEPAKPKSEQENQEGYLAVLTTR